jgi:hypothetical protein
MNFETLIWVVIFLVYILLFILKRMFAASKAAKQSAAQQPAAKKTSGWKEKLDGFMAQLKKELEGNQQEQPGDRTGWDDLIPREPRKVDPRETEPLESGSGITEGAGMQKEPALETGRVQAPPSALKPSEKQDLCTVPDLYTVIDKKDAAPVVEPSPEPARADRFRPAAKRRKRMPFDSRVEIQDLRRAVIWSEILAPPIALRDFPERKIA